MNETIELKTLDNHNFNAFISRPDTKPKGGLVIIQEIFGVNEHIREVCRKFMKEGYLTIAPSLFDRESKNIELDYTKSDINKGRFLKEKYNSLSLNEIKSSIEYVKSAGKVGVVGYCWGLWLARILAILNPACMARHGWSSFYTCNWILRHNCL